VNVLPGLLGLSFAFWGWQVDLIAVGLALGVGIEARHFIALGLDLSRPTLHKVVRFTVLAVGMTAVAALVLGPGGIGSTLALLRWLPLAFAPLAFALGYCTAGQVDMRTLAGALSNPVPPRNRPPIDFGYGLVAVCLLSASSANQAAFSFYVCLCALAALTLWRARPRQIRLSRWIVTLGVAAAIGYPMSLGLQALQTTLMGAVTELFIGDGDGVDPYRRSTAIGEIGSLKVSDTIVLRVRSERGDVPTHLHRSVYDSYVQGNWLARKAPLRAVPPMESFQWRLSSAEGQNEVVIAGSTEGQRELIALPPGVAELTDLDADSLQRNRLGSTAVGRPAGSYAFRASWQQGKSSVGEPSPADLEIQSRDGKAMAAVAVKLDLEGKGPRQRIGIIREFFGTGFRYALHQPERERFNSPLSDFINEHRSGHCEYFATATTLLIRAAGIPARYVTGYSVQEWSALEDAFVVRRRHAHAWTIAWLEGRWVTVDTTPATWAQTEADQASVFEPVVDWLSWMLYRYGQWRASGVNQGTPTAWALVMTTTGVLALAWWGWRSRNRVRRRRTGSTPPARPLPQPLGCNSEFGQIQERLAAAGLGREPGETAKLWLQRITHAQIAGDLGLLSELDQLHQRLRFDPHGVSKTQRAQLRAGVAQWLAAFAREPPNRQGDTAH